MCAHVSCTKNFKEKKNKNKNPACCYDLFEIENGHKIHHGFPLARLKKLLTTCNHIKMLLPLRKLNCNLYYCAAAPEQLHSEFNVASSRGCRLSYRNIII